MRRAFTLIELLVVIAIIAILAAILFPVFAQAKDSAKDTQNLSAHKQIGLSVLMYANDNEDQFPLSMLSSATDPIDLAWQDNCQPYIKSWDLLIHVKRRRPTGTVDQIAWKRIQYFGITPRPQTVSTAAIRTAGYYVYNQATLTGGVDVRFDGIAGFGNLSDPAADWLSRIPGASLSTSGIEGIADVVMIAESQNWDMWWSIGDYAFKYCVKWTPEAEYNSYAGEWGFAGPGAYKRPVGGRSGVNVSCFVPNGMTTYVAADGSAKAVDFRGKILERVRRSDGTYVFRRLWSGGIN